MTSDVERLPNSRKRKHLGMRSRIPSHFFRLNYHKIYFLIFVIFSDKKLFMTSCAQSNLSVSSKLLAQYEIISQEIIGLAQQEEILSRENIDQLCQKVHAFARSAIDSPIFLTDDLDEVETEADLNPPYSSNLKFRSLMQSWKRLTSIIPPTTGADQYLRSKYILASLEFQQRLNQTDPVTQALVRLQQRRLSLHTFPNISNISKPCPSTATQNLDAAPTFLFSSSAPHACLNDAYNRVSLLFSSHTLALPPYSFSNYWTCYCSSLNNEEKARFLSALLYRFYLNDVDLPSVKVSTAVHPMEVFCWQILAENISENALTSILHQLPFEQKARLACLAFAHYREGSFFIAASFKISEDPEIIEMIRLCQREQGNCASIAKELQALPFLNRSCLHEFIAKYDSSLNEKASGLFSRMEQLLPLIYKLHDTRKTGDLAIRKQYGLQDLSSEELSRVNAVYAQEAKTFASLFSFPQTSSSETMASFPFDQADFLRFLRTFGYAHLALPPGFGVSPHLPFLDALDALILAYSSPQSSYRINRSSLHSQLNYLSNLLAHVQALKNPSGYAIGARTTLFSLPTCGKDLSKLSWLPSMAENLRTYCQTTGSNIQDFPIFVFDQSPTPLFLRNASYVDNLNSRYGTRICVYSNEQILELSKKLNLGQFIDTTKQGKLGYGGARNAVYMLSPLLKELDGNGLKTPQAVLNFSSDQLRQMFLKTISQNLWSIHMGDDDAQIPYAYFLSDLLLAQVYQGRSIVKYGKFIGRDSIHINSVHFQELFNLEKILASPHILFEQFATFEAKLQCRMCGTLRSFGWSILPFGHEEVYNAEDPTITDDVRPAGFHLAGRRLPIELFPSSPIIGITHQLKNYIPYLLQAIMVSDLIDPSNKYEQTILPWKNKKIDLQTFAHLNSVFETLSSPATEKTMRTQLLKNYWEQHKNPAFLSVFHLLSLIASHDVNGSINAYLQMHPHASRAEMQEIEDCLAVFEGFQRDSEAFFVFNKIFFDQFPISSSSNAWINDLAEQSIRWKDLLNGCRGKAEAILTKPISSFPMAQSLLLILETIVGGELHQNARDILHS